MAYTTRLYLDIPLSEDVKPGIYDGDFSFIGATIDGERIKLKFFSSSYGNIYKTLFAPDGKYPYDGESVEQAKTRERNKNIRALVDVCRAVISDPKEYINISAETYEDFIAKIVDVLNKHVDVPVKLSLVANRSGDIVIDSKDWIGKASCTA